MNTLALTVAVGCASASIGIAAWLWWVAGEVGDELRELAGFEAIDFER